MSFSFYFLDVCPINRSKRPIQVADLIAFSLFREFEYNDDAYYSIIKDCFDKDNNKQHGLYVLEKK